MSCGRDYVRIEKPVTVRDATNGASVTWEKLLDSFCELTLVRGREDSSSSSGDRQTRIETWLLELPFRSDLVGITDHRAVIDGVNYNIRSAMDRARTRRNITIEIELGVAI